MDGAGVLFDDKDPVHVAALMDAIVSDAALQDAIVDGQLAAVDRLRAKDFAGTLLGFVDRILAGAARRGAAGRVRFLAAVRRRRGARGDPACYRPAAVSRRCRRPSRPAMIVNQWVPAAHNGDAIGDSARRVRDLLRGMGHESELYALTIDDELRERRAAVRAIRRAQRGDLTIFHYALPSPMTEAFAALPVAAACCSITTSRRRRTSRRTIRRCSASRRSAATSWRRWSARRSRARRLGVQPAGARGARVRADRRLPDRRRHRRGSRSRSTGRRSNGILDDGLVNFLFVGRIAPNKKIEDHIRLAEHYKRYVDAYYRFIFVGRYDVVPRYYSMIRALMTRVPLARRPIRVHRPGLGRRARRLLPPRRGLHLAERARGLLRAAGRGDGRRRAGAGLRGGRRSRHARRRGRAVRAEGPRIRRGARSARWRSTTACARRSSPASGGGSPISATRASARELRHAASTHSREDRLRHPALRRRGPRRIRAPVPARRRAARRAARRRRADHLRARLHHLEERVSGRQPTASAASPSGGSPARARATSTRSTRYSEWIYNNPHSRADEMEWLKQQGPWCPALIELPAAPPAAVRRPRSSSPISTRRRSLGLEIAPQRSVLVSTAHDEPAIRLEIFKDVFSKPAALCYLTESERRFVQRQFPERPLLEEVVGVGVDIAAAAAVSADAGPARRRRACRRAAAIAEPDTATEDERGAARIPVASARARRGLPPAPPAVRPDRAVRRPDRSGQGLRGADRVLQPAT